MNVGEIRDFVRLQLDVDEEEYPNELLDAYIEEAFVRTVALEPWWPTYQSSWPVTKADGETTLDPPSNLNVAQVDSIINLTTGQRLLQIGPEQAEDFLLLQPPLSGFAWFTVYGGVIELWPQLTGIGEQEYKIRGQRMPGVPTSTDSDVPDCDVRLHRLLCHYVIGMMYANQEDEVLEEVYMKRWAMSFAAIRRAIFAVSVSKPLIMSGGLRYRSQWAEGPVAVWDLP